jgi:hypothetical protein
MLRFSAYFTTPTTQTTIGTVFSFVITPRGQVRLVLRKTRRNANLSENQEDKLALLRTLQGVLYTTRDESLTNLLSKYE